MARYRVGAGGNWNDTAYWSATDGGATGASVPTSADNVYINANASGIVTVNVTSNTLNLDFTGFAGTFAGSSVLNVYGNITLVAGMSRTYSGALRMQHTSGTKTITSNGKNLDNISLNGVGGTTQLVDGLTLVSNIQNTSGGTFDANSQTVTFASVAATINGDFTFYDLTRTGTATKTNNFAIGGNITVTNNLIINGNSSINRMNVYSNTVGTPRTITAANVTVTNADFQDITGAGTGSWDLSAITGLSGDCGGNSGITFTTPTTQDCSAGTTWSTATWTSRVPLPQDTATFSGSSRTITQDMPRIGSVDFTGSSGLTWTTSTACSVYGGVNLTDLGTLTASTQDYSFSGRGSYTLTSAGKTWAKSFTLDAPNGTLTLQDDLVSGSSSSLTITRGTFNANNFNITLGSISSVSSSTIRSIIMGSGTWTLQASGTPWNTSLVTNLTLNPETSTIKLNNNSSIAKTVNGGGLTFYNLYNATLGSGTFTITGSNTFNQLKADTGRTTLLTTATTTKISSIDMVGATLQSTTATDANLDLQNILPLSALDGITLTDITLFNVKTGFISFLL